MAGSIDKTSDRQQFDAIKDDFNQLSQSGKKMISINRTIR